jgi:hypothetical protein
MPQE